MTFALRPFHRSDLLRLESWIRFRDPSFQSFDPRMLPSGLVVEDQSTPSKPLPLAMGFLYRTDTAMWWIEWLATNPVPSHEVRSAALDQLIAALHEKARGEGALWLFTSTNLAKLVDRLKAHGYNEAGTGITHLVRRI